ncbi:MAG: pentapeptide repeat-containing protein [Phycicoccus sp.]
MSILAELQEALGSPGTALPDMRGADLSAANLRRAVLSDADLSGHELADLGSGAILDSRSGKP